MTDSLRDRIAAVLKAANDRVAGFIGYDEMADAVIEALGMRIQVAGPDGIVGTGNYRYVTEWSNDD